VQFDGNLLSPAELSGKGGQAVGGLLPLLSCKTARGREIYFRRHDLEFAEFVKNMEGQLWKENMLKCRMSFVSAISTAPTVYFVSAF